MKLLTKWILRAAAVGLAALLFYMALFLREGDLHVLQSRILDEPRHYSVYLPAGYQNAAPEQYPVVYSLDGEKWRHGAILAANSRFLAALGLAPRMIVIAIHTEGHRSRDFAPQKGAAAFTDFLRGELMPEIEASYGQSKYNAISGHSHGGLYALYALTAHPGLFDVHVAIVPSVFHDPGIVPELKDYLEQDAMPPAQLYLYSGLESERFWQGYNAALALLQPNKSKKLTWQDGYFPLPHPLIMLPGQFAGLMSLSN